MYRLQVPKLHCDNCAGRVRRAVVGVDPTASVEADLTHREITVETSAHLDDIKAALEKIGYPVVASSALF